MGVGASDAKTRVYREFALDTREVRTRLREMDTMYTVLSQINSGACYFRGVKKISARPLRRDDFGGPSQRVRLMRASLLVPLNFFV